jgi:hypothetical protein
MPGKPLFLVIEDDEPRIDFLRETFGTYVEIEWAVSVRAFLAAAESISPRRLAAVIWDHDLGAVGHNRDADGLRGIDAAKVVDLPRHIYQLIWSLNPVGAKNIYRELAGRGYTSVDCVEAKTANRAALAARLTSAILAWRRAQ